MRLHGLAGTHAEPWHMGRNGKGGTEIEVNPERENSLSKEAETRMSTEYLGSNRETGLSQSGDKQWKITLCRSTSQDQC